MRKRTDITDTTKNNLKEAFWKLYETRGINQISVKNITDMAGYNRGTFYLYYRNVNHILEQIENEMLNDADEYFGLVRESLRDMHIQDLMKFVFTLYGKHCKYVKVLFSEHGDPKFEIKWKNKVKTFLRQYFEKNLKDKGLQAEYLLEFYVSGLLGVEKMWFDNEQDLPFEDLVNLMYGVMFK